MNGAREGKAEREKRRTEQNKNNRREEKERRRKEMNTEGPGQVGLLRMGGGWMDGWMDGWLFVCVCV